MTDREPIKAGIDFLKSLKCELPKVNVILLTILPENQIKKYLDEINNKFHPDRILSKLQKPPSSLCEIVNTVYGTV